MHFWKKSEGGERSVPAHTRGSAACFWFDPFRNLWLRKEKNAPRQARRLAASLLVHTCAKSERRRFWDRAGEAAGSHLYTGKNSNRSSEWKEAQERRRRRLIPIQPGNCLDWKPRQIRASGARLARLSGGAAAVLCLCGVVLQGMAGWSLSISTPRRTPWLPRKSSTAKSPRGGHDSRGQGPSSMDLPWISFSPWGFPEPERKLSLITMSPFVRRTRLQRSSVVAVANEALVVGAFGGEGISWDTVGLT